jgi:hypothetical protein
MGLDDYFIGVARCPPLENLDEELERYLRRVSFALPSYFHVIVLALIGHLFLHALALSENQHEKRVTESA